MESNKNKLTAEAFFALSIEWRTSYTLRRAAVAFANLAPIALDDEDFPMGPENALVGRDGDGVAVLVDGTEITVLMETGEELNGEPLTLLVDMAHGRFEIAGM